MDSKIPTEQQIAAFIKACKEADHTMVKYFLYYYQVPFLEGYKVGNRLIKNLIKKDARRLYFVKIMLGHAPASEYFVMLGGAVTYNLVDPYSDEDLFHVICHCELYGRNKKFDWYHTSKSLIPFLCENNNRESKAPVSRLPKEIFRYIAEFL